MQIYHEEHISLVLLRKGILLQTGLMHLELLPRNIYKHDCLMEHN